jgi:hypothetical protein
MEVGAAWRWRRPGVPGTRRSCRGCSRGDRGSWACSAWPRERQDKAIASKVQAGADESGSQCELGHGVPPLLVALPGSTGHARKGPIWAVTFRISSRFLFRI